MNIGNDLNKMIDVYSPIAFESVILGTILMSKEPSRFYEEKIKSRLNRYMFSDENNPLFYAISEMCECNEPLRNYLIIQKCKENNHLISAETIVDIRSKKEDIDNIDKTISTFIEQWTNFNLIKAGLEYANNLQKGVSPLNAYSIMNQRNSEIDELKTQLPTQSISLQQVALNYIQDLNERMKRQNPLIGISFFSKKMDEMIGGFQKKGFYFIGGAGGDGKTTAALQMADKMAKYHKVDFYSLEMSKMHLIPKLLSAKTGISKNSMQRATVSEFDINKLNTAANEKINNNLEIIDNITDLDLLILSIKSRLKRYGTECIFIDNRTNIKNRIKGNSDEKNGLISYIFKDLAMELDIPIVMLVHKNKEMNTRTDKRPVTNDVKYGGDIAADVVIFAYRPLETDENKRSDDFKYAEWVVTKNRVGGDIGYVPLLYDESYDTFFDIGFDDLPMEGYDPYQKDESLAAFEKAMSEPLPQTIPKPNFTEMTESEAAEYF